MSHFTEPPTPAALDEARSLAQQQQADIERAQADIEKGEMQLAALVADTQRAIDTAVQRKRALEQRLLQTQAYLSPMRRLPPEMLREVFLLICEEDARAAWGLSAVCQSWRAMALGIPQLWSKIHFSTAQLASADIVRLWLARAHNCPLDIEIFVEAPGTQTPAPAASVWVPFQGGWVAAHPAAAPVAASSPASVHWAHVVTYYLVGAMARWRRFVLRFDRHFPSMDALQSISGDAPLLEEFEVCTAEAAYFPEWRSFLPCSHGPVDLPRLRSVTLHHISFGLMGPLLVRPPAPDGQLMSLTSMTLRALPSMVIPLNQVIALVTANPLLETLVLYFPSLQPPVLPLSSYPPITLAHLRTLALGGRAILTYLVDKLVIPNLRHLAWDIDTRAPERTTLRRVLERLLKRSGPDAGASIEEISLGWGFPYPPQHPLRPPPYDAADPASLSPYAAPPLIGGLRPLLRLTPNLRALSAADVPLDLIFGVLGGFGDAEADAPGADDEDADAALVATSFTGWTSPAWAAPASDDGAGVNGLGGAGPQAGGAYVCPRLTRLALRACPSVHAQEALRRMVGFVQGRNPGGVRGGAGAGAGASAAQVAFLTGKPVRLEELEMVGCSRLEPDIGHWLESRVPHVVCRSSEPFSREGTPFSAPSP